MSKNTIYTSRVSWEKQSYNKRKTSYGTATQNLRLYLLETFHVGVEGRWGDLHFLVSGYIVARDIKHKPMVP